MAALLSQAVQRFGSAFLDLVFPPRCVWCGREGTFLCQACIGSSHALEGPSCYRCERSVGARGVCPLCMHEPAALDGVLSPFAMEGAVRQGVYALKYHNLRALAPPMGGAMASCLQRQGGLEINTVVPVPLHSWRWRQRGYNQAELLAREIGKRLGAPVLSRGLARLRHSPSQARSTTREERQRNVASAFVAQVSFKEQCVLLVDDVCTTGATLEACASALRQAGAMRVWAVTFAREL